MFSIQIAQLFYDEGSNQFNSFTHDTFDKGFNDLPINSIPKMCQQFQRLNNNKRFCPVYNKIDHRDLGFWFTLWLKRKFPLFLFSPILRMRLLV